MVILTYGSEDEDTVLVEHIELFDTLPQAYARAFQLLSVLGLTVAYNAVEMLKKDGYYKNWEEWIKIEEH